MKLSEIEAVSPEDFVVFEDEMPYSYVIDRGCKENAIEVDDFPKLYTAEQMQEYAKAQVLDVLNFLTYKRDGNMAKEIMKKFFEEEEK